MEQWKQTYLYLTKRLLAGESYKLTQVKAFDINMTESGFTYFCSFPYIIIIKYTYIIIE